MIGFSRGGRAVGGGGGVQFSKRLDLGGGVEDTGPVFHLKVVKLYLCFLQK